MKILVTGGAGYIGSVLVRRLLKEGHSVKVLDNLMFGGESLLGVYNEGNFQFIKGDVRDKETVKCALKNVEGIIHLAALVGHPLCCSQPQMTKEVNYEAACLLLKEAAKSGVNRFIFASTCSNYGISDNALLAQEDSLLKPLSIYAETKVKAEEYMLTFPKKKGFSFSILRLGTVFGLSPRMRFDLLINELVKDAMIKKKLIIQKPYAWRPFLHIQDAAEAFISCLKAKPEKISKEVFNVGCGNYQKKGVIEIIKRHAPDIAVEIIENHADRRDYKVSFEKIERVLGFKTRLTLEDGVTEIIDVIKNGIILDLQNRNYTNENIKNK